MESILPQLIAESCRTLQSLNAQTAAFDRIAAAAVATFHNGGTLFACGNGGSAAEAMHLTEELIGRYRSNRQPLPAVCLNADSAALTCIANDFGYDDVFGRQVGGLAKKNDLVVCFTTSGNSTNILRALAAAKKTGARSVALLGNDGGKAKGLADFELIVAGQDTGRIQEAHALLVHALLEVIEREFVR
jgi:D-sedoheptulose 7-phosphate isomerase